MQGNGYVNNQQLQPQAQQQANALSNLQSKAQPAAAQSVQQSVSRPQPQAQMPVVPPSASGVNIQIISPSVYGNQAGSTPPLYPYSPIYNYPPANINNNFSPVNYIQGASSAQPAQGSAPAAAQSSADTSATNKPLTPRKPEDPMFSKDDKPKTKKKKIVPLTDNYVKTLENYLKSPNAQARTMGIKQVIQRFKETDTRKHDAALTALMNKALQDENSNVRALAMTIPAAGYASGDEKTVAILKKLQQSKKNYNEDAILASKALIKISENVYKVEVDVPSDGIEEGK